MKLKKKPNILMIGPSLQVITGQSLAFDYATKAFINPLVVYLPEILGTYFMTLIGILRYTLKLLVALLGSKPRSVYLTISRSKHGFLRDVIAIQLSSLFKVKKIVIHLHGADFLVFQNSLRGIVKVLFDATYKKVTDAIVLAEGMKSQFQHHNFAVHVVPNGIPMVEKFCSDNKNMAQSRRILFLSNVMESKGIFQLLQAINELNNEGQEVFLDIAGAFLKDEYCTIEEVKTKFYREFNPSCMEYHGLAQGQKKANLLKNAHVLCLPSYREAQPLCIIEGLSAGLYIIASNRGFIPEMFTADEGIIINPVVNELKESIKTMILQKKVNPYQARHNRSFAKSKYSLEVYQRHIRNICYS